LEKIHTGIDKDRIDFSLHGHRPDFIADDSYHPLNQPVFDHQRTNRFHRPPHSRSGSNFFLFLKGGAALNVEKIN
jgi:hypothetical protein